MDHNSLANAQIWGCTVYVLWPRLLDDRNIPEWQPQLHQDQCAGFSKLHANKVGLDWNLTRNNISSQFHVPYNDCFKTIYNDNDDAPANWHDLISFQLEWNAIYLDNSDSASYLQDELLTPLDRA